VRSILFLVAVAVICMFFPPGAVYSETRSSSINKADNIDKADNLGEEFQNQGPWSRQAPATEGSIGTPQPEEYLAAPESQLSGSESDGASVQYPLCYDPYKQDYESCDPMDSSDFQLRFRSPDFRLWWTKGRTCPSGYYFVPGKGCYRR
jgi:hypothetical protein